MSRSAICRVWPAGINPPTRAWVVENISPERPMTAKPTSRLHIARHGPETDAGQRDGHAGWRQSGDHLADRSASHRAGQRPFGADRPRQNRSRSEVRPTESQRRRSDRAAERSYHDHRGGTQGSGPDRSARRQRFNPQRPVADEGTAAASARPPSDGFTVAVRRRADQPASGGSAGAQPEGGRDHGPRQWNPEVGPT